MVPNLFVLLEAKGILEFKVQTERNESTNFELRLATKDYYTLHTTIRKVTPAKIIKTRHYF
jgi:hypothetical protein